MGVDFVWVTPMAENVIGFCARVSNPANQNNPDVSKLLKYCIQNKHWSVFEMANLCLQINTSRAIATQILRHRSFSFQEFSQRYSEAMNYQYSGARRQDNKNRQNSIDDLSPEIQKEWMDTQTAVWNEAYGKYKAAIAKGIAKEVARMILPLGTETTLYMQGTVRSWIHYLQLRTDSSTQLEHRMIANGCKSIFIDKFPIISDALEWRY